MEGKALIMPALSSEKAESARRVGKDATKCFAKVQPARMVIGIFAALAVGAWLLH